MLTELRIREVHNRFRFRTPPADADLSGIGRIEAEMRSGMLDGVFAGIQSAPDEIICIRSIALTLRLDPRVGSLRAALAWGEALAARLCELTAAAPSDTVRRYRNLAEARLEMLADTLRGDMRHAWAWAQLGLTGGSVELAPPEALDAVVRAIIAAEEPVWPVLRQLLAAGDLPRALTAVAPVRWRELAGRLPGAARLLAAESALDAPTPEALQDARRLVARSPVARAWRSAPPIADPLLAVGALLIAYDDDPAAVALAGAPMRRRLSALRAELARIEARIDAAAGPSPSSLPLSSSSHRPPADGEPAAQQGRGAPAVRGGAGTCAAEEASPNPRAGASTAVPPAAASPSRQRRALPPAPPPQAQAATPERLPTAYGGLLFVLNLLVEAGLPGLLAEGGTLAGCKLRVALDWLARVEFGVPDDDVAVAAFCGVAPAALRGVREEAPSALQAIALHELAGVLQRLVAQRLRREPQAAALAWLLRRRGEIRFEPAWITLYLPISAVDTDVRRGALDLDPDYLPWLGAVVRYVYE